MKPRAYSYVRMSTDEQLKGDSRRRQLEASKAYAEEHGLDLADDAQLEDIGISAFKGANVREGALGQFLTAVRAGSVERGSYLLVESLDRLSREEILPAHSLFLSIVQAGINLVTLIDQRVYQAKTTNLVDMITSLVIMERAHEESKTKSLRVGAAWETKRKKAAEGVPMTARCPAWLRLSANRQSYEPIPDRVEIVRQIFADSAAGLGMYSIAARLNRAGVPAFEGKNGWHRSYIAKTLENRAVLGEFQPHVKVDRKRVSEGEPIQGYYPAIISEELYFQAQHSRAQRKIGSSGRKGPGYTNLFTGLARCAYCRSTISFENKGSGSRGGTYLVCGNSQRSRGCDATRWRYKDFEASFLAFVQELDLESILNASEDAGKRKRLGDDVLALRGELAAVADLMEKTYAVLSAGGSPEFVAGKLNELTARKSQLAERLALKEAEQRDFNGRDSRFYTSREEIKQLVKRLQMPPSDELYKLRAQIASRLKVLVETLLIAPQGTLPSMQRSIEELKKTAGGEADDVVAHMQQLAAHPEQSRRYFVVGFRDAAVRAVFPSYEDPLRFDQQIVAGQSPAANGAQFIDVLEPEDRRTPII
ncbi:recombinase family protein [Bradyrhizobium sp. CCGUVB23]|uniref:recombinase family protein n=1 Tax=Bradyrhizobium sp. CCGUVB23 TaxID=2949630 RepID=UPI0020B293D9|nr:recombinase family protein [Bradyrhizobium sp. CCGUVB23]MCP3462131.1 recombinase family protein [Bradyrhizobium sp. CCGUVB23]